jgi:hypothetical protein
VSSREQIKKLKGHTEHILDLFIGLEEKYKFIEPMLFHKSVLRNYGSGLKSRGFNVIKYSIFFSCIQDVVNLTLDDDKRTPSLKKVVNTLNDPSLRDIFRLEFSEWNIPIPKGQSKEILDALKRMEKRETEKRAKDFDRTYNQMKRNWNRLISLKSLEGFKVVRDKYTAHKEIHLEDGTYKSFDVGSLELKWKDLDKVVNMIRLVIRDINLLIRNSSFDYDGFEKNLSLSVISFWARKSA